MASTLEPGHDSKPAPGDAHARVAHFPIVGVGASAGGIEALNGFFRGLPDRPGLAIVIVTHLNPERKSHLHEVIANLTPLPVRVAEDGAVVERDTVYVLPPDAVLGIAEGRLGAARPNGRPRERKPIDVFFAPSPRTAARRRPASCCPAAAATARSASRRSRSTAG